MEEVPSVQITTKLPENLSPEQLDALTRVIKEAALKGIEIAMIPIGESRIELITPLNAESTVEKFLRDRGEAVHHVAFATSDIGASLAEAAAAGGQLLDEVARPGAHGTLIGFVHPKSVCGVLTEFVEADGKPGS